MNTSYISLDFNNKTCTTVVAQQNLQVAFDSSGKWQTDYSFNAAESLFYMKFSSMNLNETAYELVMQKMQNYIQTFNRFTSAYNLAQVYVALVGMDQTFGQQQALEQSVDFGSESASLSFGVSVNPAVMFESVVSVSRGTLFSANATATYACGNGKLRPVISQTAGKVSILYEAPFHSARTPPLYVTEQCETIMSANMYTLNLTAYGRDYQECNVAVDAEENGARHKFTVPLSMNYQNVDLQVDLTSVLVAISQNTAMLSGKLDTQNISSAFGYPKRLVAKTFSRFPNMDSIYCVPDGLPRASSLNPTNGGQPNDLCFVRVKEKNNLANFALPVMLSLANNPQKGITNLAICKCPIEPELAEMCNTPNFVFMLVGLYLPDVETQSRFDEAITGLTAIVAKYVNASDVKDSVHLYQRFMEATFPVAQVDLLAEPSSFDSHVKPAIANAFEFCDHKCFVVLIQSYGLSAGISTAGYSLAGTACAGRNVFPSDAAWNALSRTPPVPLVQPYFKCTYTWENALSTGIGIANGVSLVLISLFAIVGFPLMVSAFEYLGYIQPKATLGDEYNAEDKAMALDELALQLLRIRDGDKRGIAPGGQLEELVKDLINTAKNTARISKAEGSDGQDGGNFDASADVQHNMKPRMSASVFLDLDDNNPSPSDSRGVIPDTKNPMIKSKAFDSREKL